MKIAMQKGQTFSGNLSITQTIAKSKSQLQRQTAHYTSSNALDQKLINMVDKLIGGNAVNVGVPAKDINTMLANIAIHPKYQGKILVSNYSSAAYEKTIEISPQDVKEIGATSFKFVI